jgi:hypothetical protein
MASTLQHYTTLTQKNLKPTTTLTRYPLTDHLLMFQVHLGQFSDVLYSPTFCLSDHKWGTLSSAETPTRDD